MAKKKIEIDEIENVEAVVTNEADAEIEEETVEAPDYTEEFIARQLKSINKSSNRAKAKRLAERILRNRKGN